MEKFMTFDPLDPLDLCIMVDPNYDTAVDELTAHTENAAIGRDTYLSEAYETEIGADQFKAEDDDNVGFADDNDSTDMPADFAAEDAEDYSAAEMELLSGDFGNPIDAVDGIEFTGMD